MESTFETDVSVLSDNTPNHDCDIDKDELLRIKTAADKKRGIFNERDDLWLQIQQIKDRSFPNIVFAVPIAIFLVVNGAYISPFLDRARAMAVWTSDVYPGTRLVVVIQDLLFFISLGITVFMIYKRSAKKTRLSKLETEIASFYDECSAKKVPYELFHPYTLERLIALTDNGFTFYHAIDELRKDCAANQYNYQDYAKIISIEAEQRKNQSNNM